MNFTHEHFLVQSVCANKLTTDYLLHNPETSPPESMLLHHKKNITKQPSQYLRITSIGDVFFAAFSAF